LLALCEKNCICEAIPNASQLTKLVVIITIILASNRTRQIAGWRLENKNINTMCVEKN